MTMPDIIPPADQSAAKMIHMNHQIAEGHKGMQPGLGQVITPPPNLSVRWNNITLTKDKLYLSEYWLKGHRREAKGQIKSATQYRGGGSGDPAYESHNHDIDNDYTDDIIYTDTLKPGDWVSVYPVGASAGTMEGQLFMVESKMVKL